MNSQPPPSLKIPLPVGPTTNSHASPAGKPRIDNGPPSQRSSIKIKTGPAPIRVVVSLNLLEAFVILEKPAPGAPPLKLEAYLQTLAQAKVVCGVDFEALEQLLERPRYCQQILVARGQPPVHGTHGLIHYLFNAHHQVHPQENEDGSVDLRELGLVDIVQVGQKLAVVTPSTAGENGVALTGQPIPANPGRAVPSPIGSNVAYDSDGVSVVALTAGQASLIGGKIAVNASLTIAGDVGNATGNVRFVGDLVIRGGVQSGFVVESTGNIEISGVVEAASIKAGGNIVIRAGVHGRDAAKLECGGTLTTKFLESCTVNAGGSVRAETIIGCRLVCGGDLALVGINSAIIGGHVMVGGNVTVRVVGARTGTPTIVDLGASPNKLQRFRELEKGLPPLHADIDRLTNTIAYLEAQSALHQLPAPREIALQKYKVDLEAAHARLASETHELEGLKEQLSHTEQVYLHCKEAIHPGSQIAIGRARLAVTDTLRACKFVQHEGVVTDANLLVLLATGTTASRSGLSKPPPSRRG